MRCKPCDSGHSGNLRRTGMEHPTPRVIASFAPILGPHCLTRPLENREAPWSGHSHSIVSGTYKRLKVRDLLIGYAGLTVKSTAGKFRLRPIDGDRCRKGWAL